MIGLIDPSSNSSSRIAIRFLDEVNRGAALPNQSKASDTTQLALDFMHLLIVAREVLPEALSIARAVYGAGLTLAETVGEYGGAVLLDSSSNASPATLSHIAALANKLPLLSQLDPEAVYGLVSAANVLGSELNEEKSARAAESAALAYNFRLCNAYGVEFAPRYPALYGSPVFGSAVRLPIIEGTNVDNSVLQGVGEVKMGVNIANQLGSALGLAGGVMSIVPVVGMIAGLVGSIFGMFNNTDIPPGKQLWISLTNGTLRRVDEAAADEFVKQLVAATDVPPDTHLAYVIAQMLGYYTPTSLLVPSAAASRSAAYGSGQLVYTASSGYSDPANTALSQLTSEESMNAWRGQYQTTQPMGLNPQPTAGFKGARVPSMIDKNALIALVSQFGNLAAAEDHDSQPISAAIGWVRTLQALTGRDYTPALKILMFRNPAYQSWLTKERNAVGFVANYQAPVRQLNLPAYAINDQAGLVDSHRRYFRAINEAGWGYADHLLTHGRTPPRVVKGYNSDKRMRDESVPCQSEGPSFWRADGLSSGPVFDSNVVTVDVGTLPDGVYGETQIDTLPFKVTINKDITGSRGQIALAHEMGHVMDETYKLNLSHDQVHQVGVFAATEMLPAMEAFKAQQAL